jgi:NAD kinase
VNIDGQNFYSLLSKETLRIAKAEFNVRWITMGKRDFFHVLRTKLHWGSNGRNSTVPAIKKNRYIR